MLFPNSICLVFFFFIMKGCRILLNAFSVSIEILICFYFSNCVCNVSCYSFAYVESSQFPWEKSQLFGLDDVSDVLMELVSEYFIEGFCIYVYQGYLSVVLFHAVPFSGLGIKVMLAS